MNRWHECNGVLSSWGVLSLSGWQCFRYGQLSHIVPSLYFFPPKWIWGLLHITLCLHSDFISVEPLSLANRTLCWNWIFQRSFVLWRKESNGQRESIYGYTLLLSAQWAWNELMLRIIRQGALKAAWLLYYQIIDLKIAFLLFLFIMSIFVSCLKLPGLKRLSGCMMNKRYWNWLLTILFLIMCCERQSFKAS